MGVAEVGRAGMRGDEVGGAGKQGKDNHACLEST